MTTKVFIKKEKPSKTSNLAGISCSELHRADVRKLSEGRGIRDEAHCEPWILADESISHEKVERVNGLKEAPTHHLRSKHGKNCSSVLECSERMKVFQNCPRERIDLSHVGGQHAGWGRRKGGE
jgi:hypothetical protein